jgi:hypothetical protein
MHVKVTHMSEINETLASFIYTLESLTAVIPPHHPGAIKP